MNDRTHGNGAVLGIAAVAAGAVGTIVTTLLNRDADGDSRAHLEGRLRELDSRSRVAARKTRKTMKKAQKRAPREIDLARERAIDLGAQVTGLAESGLTTVRSRIDAGDLQDASRRFTSTLKKRSRKGVVRAESAGTETAAKAAELLSEARNQVPNLKDRAGKAAVNARSVGSTLGEQVRERLPEVRDQVEHRVAPIVKDLQKQARPLVSDAAAAAATALGVAGTKAHDAREWAEKDALPEVRDTLGDVSHQIVERAKSAEHLLAHASSDASGRLSDVGGVIEDRSRQAASVAVKGTKDTGSLLFWTTVGAGVVFYAFLSKEQRGQVRAAGKRVAAEAREIYRDIQGHDEELS